MRVPLLAGKWRNELAGGQIVQGAEAAAELVGAQAAVAVERTYKLDGVAVGLQRVAIQTTRDEVAVGIAAEAGLRDDVVEAPSLGNEADHTVAGIAPPTGLHGRR